MEPHGTAARLPPNHRLVYEVVRSQEPGVHAAVGDIFARAKAIRPTLGYSTVYRALDRLCRLGLVLELHVPGLGAALFEPARPNHAHFVCGACGRVEDVDVAIPSLDIRAAVGGRGGAVDDIVVTAHGICGSCRAADSTPKPPGPSARAGRNA